MNSIDMHHPSTSRYRKTPASQNSHSERESPSPPPQIGSARLYPHLPGLQAQDRLLADEASVIARERAGFAQDPVAGHHEADGAAALAADGLPVAPPRPGAALSSTQPIPASPRSIITASASLKGEPAGLQARGLRRGADLFRAGGGGAAEVGLTPHSSLRRVT
jgi:hypothetical protein